MEYIDKRKAWTALKAEAESHELPASKEAYKRAARIIDQMPTVQIMEWISCDERMPELDNSSQYSCVKVICATENDKVLPLTYQKSMLDGKEVRRWEYTWGKIYDGCPITHWMPFPNPPKR